MCLPALPLAILGASAIAGGAAAYSASKQASATNNATAAAERNAAATNQAATEAANKANQKTPDIAAMFARNQEAAASGQSATFLTGAGGAGTGVLGKTTLLGS